MSALDDVIKQLEEGIEKYKKERHPECALGANYAIILLLEHRAELEPPVLRIDEDSIDMEIRWPNEPEKTFYRVIYFATCPCCGETRNYLLGNYKFQEDAEEAEALLRNGDFASLGLRAEFVEEAPRDA